MTRNNAGDSRYNRPRQGENQSSKDAYSRKDPLVMMFILNWDAPYHMEGECNHPSNYAKYVVGKLEYHQEKDAKFRPHGIRAPLSSAVPI